MPRAKKTIHQPFEGRDPRGQFTKITRSMMQSSAWKDLSLRQQGLYLHLKAKYTQKVTHGIVESTNRDNISLPKTEWFPTLYGDYRTFSADMQRLEDNGFIRTIRYGKAMHQCNLYGFTDEWSSWAPPPPP